MAKVKFGIAMDGDLQAEAKKDARSIPGLKLGTWWEAAGRMFLDAPQEQKVKYLRERLTADLDATLTRKGKGK